MPKCDVKVCKAICCYNIPMEKGYLSAYKKRVVTPPIRWEDWGDGTGLVITDDNPEKNKCPFLRDDCKCNIYDVRPKVCRLFGTTPGVKFLNCHFLSGIPDEFPDYERASAFGEIEQLIIKGKI